MRAMRMVLVGVALVGLGSAPGVARGAGLNDDLSVVKHAVSANPSAAARDEASPVPEKQKGAAPQWLKVRVVDKTTHKTKVTVNLPLALVHAMGDDFPVNLGCHGNGDKKAHVRLGEILKSLEAGQDIVQVDEEDQTVRVWVE